MDNSIFNHFSVNGNRIELPEMSVVEISKQDYAQIKKIMLNNLGKYKKNGFNFPYNPAELLEKLKAGDNETMVKKFQFFPTPAEVMDKMLQITLPLEPLKILEPQAGQGHIIKEIKNFTSWDVGHTFHACELHPINRAILKEEHPDVEIIGENFLELEPDPTYDLVIMNPPFTTKGDKHHYLTHIEHAQKFLGKYGELISVVPDTFILSKDKRIIDYKNENDFSIYKLDGGSFKSSGTMVETSLLQIKNYV